MAVVALVGQRGRDLIQVNGQNPVDLEDLDLTPIGPLPSYVWYQDMAGFAERFER